MKRTLFSIAPEETETSCDRRGLRLVSDSSRLIEWPLPACDGIEQSSETSSGVLVTAEVQAKRFRDRSIDSDRYTATVLAQNGSPYSIMAALVEACADIQDFQQIGAHGDQIILQINLRSQPVQ